MLSHAEVRAILAHVKNPVHRTCFVLMYACGLRISEAVKVEIADIDSAGGVLRVIGKGDKKRTFIVSDKRSLRGALRAAP